MKVLSRIKGIDYYHDEPMARHTSFRIGGKARYYLKVHSYQALKSAVKWLKASRIRFFVIGAGTNILVNDHGFNGAVIQLTGTFTKIKQDGDHFICGSALRINKMIEKGVLLGYGGAEFLAGIPGTIGGGIKGNAGAFGCSFADIVDSVSVLTPDNKIRILIRKQIGFRYRGSRIPDTNIILSARLYLKRKARGLIKKEVIRVIAYRRDRQPQEWSAGSFFKNPAGNPAGQLIDECGFKGSCVGDAQVSKKHANFIINRGCATANDVMKLAAIIKSGVFKKTGIKLQMEVRILK
ncbi:UDP-N-acetylenolpyruvoylglucosamine reductase [candidate division WOR-3 bacterium RBG_13_43_14]|uniref:UDP-N-acetylenolpyruvoylglucosamine reductase n=1 Tax=candidate division WOR-3 bacterium RBG_13_43_14 TaxID=1802590 RepID=A0A1F4U8J9_UNCW3|nr:MAG: UDP-N-acetylenolpyruvoylglucosamine reductase [candidate division WOR-3 bacterium RBG_13_43_14]